MCSAVYWLSTTRHSPMPRDSNPRAADPKGVTGQEMTTQPDVDETFDSSGVLVRYQVYGEGDPIVLVHGFASSN